MVGPEILQEDKKFKKNEYNWNKSKNYNKID